MATNTEIQTTLINNNDVIQKWFVSRESAHKTNKLPIGVLHPIKEIFSKEVSFPADMQRLKNGLVIMQSKVSAIDKVVLENYIAKVDAVFAAHAKLDFLSAVSSPENDINKVLSNLQEKYKSPDFKECIDKLAELGGDREKIDTIYTKYSASLLKNKTYTKALGGAPLDSYTIMPIQKITRFQMPVEETRKFLGKLVKDNESPIPAVESLITKVDETIKTIKDEAKRGDKKIGDLLSQTLADVQPAKKSMASSIIYAVQSTIEKAIDFIANTVKSTSEKAPTTPPEKEALKNVTQNATAKEANAAEEAVKAWNSLKLTDDEKLAAWERLRDETTVKEETNSVIDKEQEMLNKLAEEIVTKDPSAVSTQNPLPEMTDEEKESVRKRFEEEIAAMDAPVPTQTANIVKEAPPPLQKIKDTMIAARNEALETAPKESQKVEPAKTWDPKGPTAPPLLTEPGKKMPNLAADRPAAGVPWDPKGAFAPPLLSSPNRQPMPNLALNVPSAKTSSASAPEPDITESPSPTKPY